MKSPHGSKINPVSQKIERNTKAAEYKVEIVGNKPPLFRLQIDTSVRNLLCNVLFWTQKTKLFLQQAVDGRGTLAPIRVIWYSDPYRKEIQKERWRETYSVLKVTILLVTDFFNLVRYKGIIYRLTSWLKLTTTYYAGLAMTNGML